MCVVCKNNHLTLLLGIKMERHINCVHLQQGNSSEGAPAGDLCCFGGGLGIYLAYAAGCGF